MHPRTRIAAWLAPWACVLSALSARQGAAAGDAVALLAPGPFAVGFRSTWALDEGRTYRTAWDEGKTYGAVKAPRPVLVELWFPARASADAARMSHGGYFEITGPERDAGNGESVLPRGIPGRDERVRALAEALRAHALGVFVQEVFGEPEAGLDDGERAELERLLAAPTACRIAAVPEPGPFPLVLYHSGAGSSFEDNAALCEFLASHGYVVLASAYPRADGSALGIDAGRGSAEDAQFLVRWARALPFADWRRVALVGHSAGAQAFLKFAAQPGCVADALVLLDTTQDYYGLALPLHESVVREAREGVQHLTRPMLVAAGPEAHFALCDTRVNAERLYLTVPELGHNEYISQGLQRLQRIEWRAAAGAPIESGELARTPAARATYRELCDVLRAFLDAELGREGAGLAARLERERVRPWTHDAVHLVRVARGVAGPEPYDLESDAPPTPRQFARLVMEQGAESGCAVLERFREAEPRGPLYTSTMLAGSLLYALSEGGRKDEAALYYSALREIPLQALSLFEFLADISGMQQKPEQALRFLRLACELDPEDAGLAAKLRRLEPAPAPQNWK